MGVLRGVASLKYMGNTKYASNNYQGKIAELISDRMDNKPVFFHFTIFPAQSLCPVGPQQSLRKVFASLDRIRTLSTDCSSSYTGVQCQPHQLKLSNQDEENHGPEQKVVENQPNNSLNDGALMQKLRTRLRDPSTNTLCTRDPKVVEEENIHPYQQIMSLGEVNVNLQNGQAGKTDGAWAPQNGDTTSSEPDWSFESFVQDQRSIEKKHEAHKESTFQKVLSALGGPTADAAELSPDVLLAWKKRKDSLAKVEANAEERRNKRKVRRAKLKMYMHLKHCQNPQSRDRGLLINVRPTRRY